MYDLVSSPTHIFVSCQHTTIKVSKRYWFQGSFSSGFDNFSPLVFFKSWQNRVNVDDRVLMDSDTIFVCFETVRNSEMFDGDFLPSKNEGKDLYVQRKKNAIDQGILATASKTLAVNHVPFWITLIAVLMRTTEETAFTSFTFDKIRQNSKTARQVVRSYTIFQYLPQKNMYNYFLKQSVKVLRPLKVCECCVSIRTADWLCTSTIKCEFYIKLDTLFIYLVTHKTLHNMNKGC